MRGVNRQEAWAPRKDVTNFLLPQVEWVQLDRGLSHLRVPFLVDGSEEYMERV